MLDCVLTQPKTLTEETIDEQWTNPKDLIFLQKNQNPILPAKETDETQNNSIRKEKKNVRIFRKNHGNNLHKNSENCMNASHYQYLV